MRIEVRTNVDKINAGIVNLSSQIKNKATIRALNLAATKVKTEAGREVRKIYNIKLGAITQATRIKKAHKDQANPRAEVRISGRPISLINFAARPVNPWNKPGRKNRKPGGGTSVQVKHTTGRKTVKHAFIATTKSGYRGVFMRESIPGAPQPRGGDQIYKDRIVNLHSISLPKAVKNQVVLNAVSAVAVRTVESEMERQIKLLTGK